MNLLKDLRHWFLHSGPVEAIVVLTDGRRYCFDLKNRPACWATLRTVDDTKLLALLTLSPKGIWNGKIIANSLHGRTTTLYGKGYAVVDDCLDHLLDVQAAHNEQIAALEANPVALLNHLLSTIDVYSHMSDDPAVWPRLDNQMREIAKVLPRVDVQTVRTLWAKHVPASAMSCPV